MGAIWRIRLNVRRCEMSLPLLHQLVLAVAASAACFSIYKEGQKTGQRRLTAYILKTSELICVIFGTMKHYFVVNSSINSILNKFIDKKA